MMPELVKLEREVKPYSSSGSGGNVENLVKTLKNSAFENSG